MAVDREIPSAQRDLFDAGGSASAKYARLIVGRPGVGAILKYEAVVLLAQSVPGALGLALRRILYPVLLGSCGKNVTFGQNVVLRHPHKIRIADDVVVDDNCLLDAKGDQNGGITIGRGVFIGSNTILSCKNGDISIGDGVNIGFNCEVFSASSVSIGPGTLLAAYAYLVGGDHAASDPDVPIRDQERVSAGIRVGRDAWIGAGVRVLDGVTIGDGAIVGANAVVREAVPDRTVAAGVPARVIGTRDRGAT